MELTSVIRAMRRHLAVVLVAFVVVLGLGIATAYLPPDRYKATAIILVQPDPDKAQFQPQVVNFVVPSLIAQAHSRTLAEQAIARLPEALRGARVKVDTVDVDGTGVVSVTASSTRQGAVAPWATAFAEQLVRSDAGSSYVILDLLDPARPPSRPYAPKRKPIVVSSVFLGMIAAVLTAIGAAAYRRRVDEVDEVRVRFGTTVLGEMPVLRDPVRRGIDAIFSHQAPAEVTEALQSLRTNVEFLLKERRPRSIAVVSASSGEGKSTISAALAWALASVGEQVTIVDADLRRPTLHKSLHSRLSPGIGSADQLPVDRLVQQTPLATLRLLSAGVANRHPAEVLRANLPLVLSALQDETVVIDCPPIEGFAETGTIATMARSVILVIDRRRNDLLDVERSLALLQERGADVLGIVINRSNRKSAAGKYYYQAPIEPSAGEAPRPNVMEDTLVGRPAQESRRVTQGNSTKKSPDPDPLASRPPDAAPTDPA